MELKRKCGFHIKFLNLTPDKVGIISAKALVDPTPIPSFSSHSRLLPFQIGKHAVDVFANT